MRYYGKRRGCIKWREIKRCVLKKETKSLSRILREMQHELDVLMALVDAQQASKREEKNVAMMIDEREGLLPSSKVVGDD
jgi:hypothetical protein